MENIDFIEEKIVYNVIIKLVNKKILSFENKFVICMINLDEEFNFIDEEFISKNTRYKENTKDL